MIIKKREMLASIARNAPIIKTFNFSMNYDESGAAIFSWPFNKIFTNGMDVHGGVISTLIDCCTWFTAAQYYQSFISTVEFDTKILEPAKLQGMRAIGKPIRVGKRLCTIGAEVFSEDGRLIAVGSSTLTTTSIPLPDKI